MDLTKLTNDELRALQLSARASDDTTLLDSILAEIANRANPSYQAKRDMPS